ncbi:MAG: hypothetical protein WDN46_00190 [Methylocella sp.]
MISRLPGVIAISAVSLLGMLHGAQADGSDNAYQAFLAVLATMTASSNTVIQNERNAGRLLTIRQALTSKLVKDVGPPSAAAPAATTDPVNGYLTSASKINGKYLLCNFRWEKTTLGSGLID